MASQPFMRLQRAGGALARPRADHGVSRARASAPCGRRAPQIRSLEAQLSALRAQASEVEGQRQRLRQRQGAAAEQAPGRGKQVRGGEHSERPSAQGLPMLRPAP
jgi:hypothetical protein